MEETRADESLPWFKQRVRQPPNQLRLFGGYGPSLRLRLLVGHAFDYLNKIVLHLFFVSLSRSSSSESASKKRKVDGVEETQEYFSIDDDDDDKKERCS